MICPHELASDLSVLSGKGWKAGPEVMNAGSAVPGSRYGANDESAGDRNAGDVETNHVVAGGGDHRDQRTADAAVERAVRGAWL